MPEQTVIYSNSLFKYLNEFKEYPQGGVCFTMTGQEIVEVLEPMIIVTLKSGERVNVPLPYDNGKCKSIFCEAINSMSDNCPCITIGNFCFRRDDVSYFELREKT